MRVRKIGNVTVTSRIPETKEGKRRTLISLVGDALEATRKRVPPIIDDVFRDKAKGSWRQLKESTVRKKMAKGMSESEARNILVETGQLQESIESLVAVVTESYRLQLGVGSNERDDGKDNAKIAFWHEEGTVNMIERPIFGDSPPDVYDAITERVWQIFYEEILKRTIIFLRRGTW